MGEMLVGNQLLWDSVRWAVVIGAALLGALSDVRSRNISNGLTVTILVLGLVCSTWAGGIGGLLRGVLASAVMALPYVVLFAVARGGAGDAKLMAALGAWLNWREALIMLTAVSVSGAVLAIAFAVSRRRGRDLAGRLTGMALRLPLPGFGALRQQAAASEASYRQAGELRMPYGPAVFVGACVAAGVVLWLS